ncbi:hypothetical protein [Polymorphospora sp. NPDC050346]|uniref:hypothetical protein n=1 Tax=Polymorphospora sp. NPDC050346 TaxID=3155780 RepID=UPI0033E31AA4
MLTAGHTVEAEAQTVMSEYGIGEEDVDPSLHDLVVEMGDFLAQVMVLEQGGRCLRHDRRAVPEAGTGHAGRQPRLSGLRRGRAENVPAGLANFGIDHGSGWSAEDVR